MIKPRKESQILEDLAALSRSPGYVHAIAYICCRDSFIYFNDKQKVSNMDWLFSKERVIRTELMTLIGLMMKSSLDLSEQRAEIIERYVQQTDAFLQELHDSMTYPMLVSISEAIEEGAGSFNLEMREPIFYGPESAYSFQYRDFSSKKYEADDDWIVENRGFTSLQARSIAKTMCSLMDKKVVELLGTFSKSWLPAFEFSLEEVVYYSSIEKKVVQAFFNAFLFEGDNSGFKEIGDFNEVAARPLLPTDRGTVLLFSHYAIYEALYESPFYWMLQDKVYKPIASRNRGIFTEKFAKNCLKKVFGEGYVYENMNIYRGKNIVGEIDVLVIYGDRVIIIQAKSKKLTIAARKGNDNRLKADFSAAIQDSYNQGWLCATELLNGGCKILNDKREEIKLPENIKEIFLFCLVSEHYPALAFQARRSLKFQTTDVIKPPLVMDVFFLDTLTEIIETPLRFLHYVKLRASMSNKSLNAHELSVLGYHLTYNSWLDDNYDTIMFDDSCAQDLDMAMMVRRDNLPGKDTPEGVLTKMRGTYYERLIKEIERNPDSLRLELGLLLLSINEDSCKEIHYGIEAIIGSTQSDSKLHDFTIGFEKPKCGITFHCNLELTDESVDILRAHCYAKKYKQCAEQWFGVAINTFGKIQFVLV